MKTAVWFLLATVAMASEYYLYGCGVPYKILYTIASVEGHHKRAIGYPYIIALNNASKEIKEKLQAMGLKRLDARSFDCKSLRLCVLATKMLLKHRVTNIDLGAFQINYHFHPMEIRRYFILKDSYKKACSILEKRIRRYGYNWDAIASYHSLKPARKSRYKKRLLQRYAQ